MNHRSGRAPAPQEVPGLVPSEVRSTGMLAGPHRDQLEPYCQLSLLKTQLEFSKWGPLKNNRELSYPVPTQPSTEEREGNGFYNPHQHGTLGHLGMHESPRAENDYHSSQAPLLKLTTRICNTKLETLDVPIEKCLCFPISKWLFFF